MLAVAHALLEESNSSPLLHFFVLSIIHTPPDDTHREEAHHVQWLDGGPCLVHQVDHCFDDDNYCRDDL